MLPSLTVAKHAAPGSSSHPLVAAALEHRSGDGGAHRSERKQGDAEPIGWPAPPREPDPSIGWPADAVRR